MEDNEFLAALADLSYGTPTNIGNVNVTRVPGGFIYVVGSTSCFVPDTENVLDLIGVELKPV